jgi:amidase
MATAGPMARSVDDLTLAYDILRGPSPSSPNTVPTVPAESEHVQLRGLRCGLFSEFGNFPVEPDISAAVVRAGRALEKRGVVVEEQSPPIKESLEIFNHYRMADGSKALLEWLGDKIHQSRPQVLERISRPEWEKSTSELYRIIIARDRYRAALASFMETFPIIIAVPFRTSAMRHHEPPVRIGGVDYDVFNAALPTNWPNIWVSCAGIPSCVVPAGQDRNRLPIGVKVVGRAFDESTVLAVAKALEEDLGGFQSPPL